jgi:hypothetical protein
LSESTVSSCWECEAPTGRLVTVILRTRARQVGSLSICPPCCDTFILPLIPWASTPSDPTDAMLLIEPGAGRELLCAELTGDDSHDPV